MVKCSKCNNYSEDGTMFCGVCGNSLYNQPKEETHNYAYVSEKTEIINGFEYIAPKEEIKEEIKEETPKKKGKLNKKRVIIALGSLLIIIALIVIILVKIFSKEETNEKTSFYLKDKNGLYAFYDVQGNKLTEFEYKLIKTSEESETFTNHSSLATNRLGKYGLISEEGKILIEFGKCKALYQTGALYECIESENSRIYYSSTGKEIAKKDNMDILSYSASNKISLIENRNSKNFIYYNYKGDELVKIPFKSNIDYGEPNISIEGNYMSVSYDGTTYIINIENATIIKTYKDVDSYCIDELKDNKFLLRTCEVMDYNTGKLVAPTRYVYKFIKDEKEVFSIDVTKEDTITFIGNNAILTDKQNKTYLLDSKGSKTIEAKNVLYMDANNYVAKSKTSGLDIYSNGKVLGHFECNKFTEGFQKEGAYVLSSCKGYNENDVILVDKEGKQIGKKAYRTVTSLDPLGNSMYNADGLLKVSENGKDYYLINNKAQKKSETYIDKTNEESITRIDTNLYIGNNSDDSKTIFDINNGTLLKDNILSYRIFNNVLYAVMLKDKYIVLDVTNNKEVLKIETEPTLEDGYIVTKNKDKQEYYSYYTAKKFLSQ